MSMQQEIRSKHLRRLQQWVRGLVALYVFSGLVLGWWYIQRHSSPSHATQRPVVATPVDTAASPSAEPTVAVVNGEAISKDEVDYAMEVTSAAAIVDRLVRETAVLQEARRQNLNTDDPESRRALVLLSEQTKDAGLYGMREKTLRSRILLRKLVLKDVPESYRHRIYETFKKPLTQYEIFDILVSSQAEAEAVQADLRNGESFEHLASRVSRDGRTKKHGGRMGFLTMARIEDILGPAAADSIARNVAEGHVNAPVRASYGLFIVKIGKILTSYVDLKPSIDSIIAQSRNDLELFQLSHEIKVSYPILEMNRKALASASPHLVEVSGSPSAAPSK